MFEYLKGMVAKIDLAYVALDASGIGYGILCPAPYSYQKNQPATIYVEQIVRNTGIILYGSLSLEGKKLLLKLLSASGIGPRSVVAIMAAEDTDSLVNAAQNGEVKYPTHFSGVGKKTTSQIILDLKGKLGNYMKKSVVATDLTPSLQDALLALVALGYTQKEVDRVTPKLAKLPENTVDGCIKETLALLLEK